MLSGRSAAVRNATGGFLLACTLTFAGPTVVHAAPDTEPNAGAPQSLSIVDPHRIRRGDQDVGGIVRA